LGGGGEKEKKKGGGVHVTSPVGARSTLGRLNVEGRGGAKKGKKEEKKKKELLLDYRPTDGGARPSARSKEKGEGEHPREKKKKKNEYLRRGHLTSFASRTRNGMEMKIKRWGGKRKKRKDTRANSSRLRPHFCSRGGGGG